MKQADVVVRGAGVVGQCLSLALAHQGLQVALVADPSVPAGWGQADVRAYALNAASVALLRQLKVWDALPPHAVTAVHEMNIHGDVPGAVLRFSSWQQAVPALAWIVDVSALEQTLRDAVRFSPHIDRVVDAGVQSTMVAPLVALCEGKSSVTRERLGVAVSRFSYGHTAVAARLTCERAHGHTARQWFGSPEVLALLPMDAPEQDRTCALVWSVPEAKAAELQALSPAEFEAALQEASQGELGAFRLTSDRMSWPLTRSEAQAWCGPGWVLLGDAAHGLHPLAGQGLNLGLADVSTLAAVLLERESWRGLGDEKLLRRYERARAAPTRVMIEGVDALWQLFAAPSTGLRELRNHGLNLVNHFTPFKRWLASQAFGS